MIYTYSRHFLQRLQERKITLQEVESILNNDVDRMVIPGKQDKSVVVMLGYVKNKGITLVVNHKTHNVVTVRRMRDVEKKIFFRR